MTAAAPGHRAREDGPTASSLLPDPEITRALRMADFLRRSPARIGGAPLHKEWQHFIVYADGLEAIVNFSLLDDPWATDARSAETLRLIVMSRAPRWEGRVDTFGIDAFTVADGGHDLAFPGGRVRFTGGVYHVDFTTKDQRIEAHLEFLPLAHPAVANNQSLSAGRTLRWLFVPSLTCRGRFRVGDKVHEIHAARAYHDHNWGYFRWGDDFSWEWGSALPRATSSPWSAVFMRMGNRNRTETRCQGLYLWRDQRPWRIFRDAELTVTSGLGDVPACDASLPPVMALLAPRGPQDLPSRLTIDARGEGDRARLTFAPTRLARVIVPSEVGTDGVTILNEMAGSVVVSGRVRGTEVRFEGPGVFELVRN